MNLFAFLDFVFICTAIEMILAYIYLAILCILSCTIIVYAIIYAIKYVHRFFMKLGYICVSLQSSHSKASKHPYRCIIFLLQVIIYTICMFLPHIWFLSMISLKFYHSIDFDYSKTGWICFGSDLWIQLCYSRVFPNWGLQSIHFQRFGHHLQLFVSIHLYYRSEEMV